MKDKNLDMRIKNKAFLYFMKHITSKGADVIKREFEYYKFFRYNYGWHDFFFRYGAWPACENSPTVVDYEEEENNEELLWQDFLDFMSWLSEENYRKFAHDAKEWAEK